MLAADHLACVEILEAVSFATLLCGEGRRVLGRALRAWMHGAARHRFLRSIQSAAMLLAAMMPHSEIKAQSGIVGLLVECVPRSRP